jgi:hypothetical protein
MPFIMCFQGPPGAEPLNHTPLPHVNSLSSKLIDSKVGLGENEERCTLNRRLNIWLLFHNYQ